VAEKALKLQAILDWLDEGRLATPDVFLPALCQQLLAHGVPVARVAVFARTLHPNVAGRGFFWHAEKPADVEFTTAEHDWMESDAHLASPIHAITSTGQEIRRRLADPDCTIDFPVLADLRKEGMTDYYATPLPTITGEKLLASFTTRRPGGFSDEQLAALQRLRIPVGRIAEIMGLRRKAHNILEAYLGAQTGQKVLAGQIKRGDGEEIRAGDLVLRPARLDAARRIDEPRGVPEAAQRILRVRARTGAGARRRDPALHRRRGARHLPDRQRSRGRWRARKRWTPRANRWRG
jgi:adenylate cyclase